MKKEREKSFLGFSRNEFEMLGRRRKFATFCELRKIYKNLKKNSENIS
jgi:hypothetical protein